MALACPAEKDGFSYAGDSLYCEASNHSRHRRATIPELKAHFNGKDDENRPGHWYEAQLLHYGLAPSKVKGTAHKRLFDAVIKGGLVVPAHIQKIEAGLKKEWAKKEREAKKLLKESATAATLAKEKGTKRKADQVSSGINVNVSVQVCSNGSVSVKAAEPATKKIKTLSKATSAQKTTPAEPISTKATPKASKAPATKAPKSKDRAPATPRSIKRPDNMRSGPSSSTGIYSDAPCPYSAYDPAPTSSSHPHLQLSSQHSSQPGIGLLDGRYRVECDYIENGWPEYGNDLGLIATLDGNNLWLTFDFGAAVGMMKVDLPHAPDFQRGTTMLWRGHAFYHDDDRREGFAVEDPDVAEPDNKLWFLGDDHISGMMSWGSSSDPVMVEFDAYRLSGQSMTSEISPSQARSKWSDLRMQIDEEQYQYG